jgi:thioredoxin-like negative regulator of GroEL
MGMSLFQMGKYAEARVPLEETLGANPKDNNIELFLINDLIRPEQFEAARRICSGLRTESRKCTVRRTQFPIWNQPPRRTLLMQPLVIRFSGLPRDWSSAGRQAEMQAFSKLDANARAAIAQEAEEVIKNKETAH